MCRPRSRDVVQEVLRWQADRCATVRVHDTADLDVDLSVGKDTLEAAVDSVSYGQRLNLMIRQAVCWLQL